MEALAIIAAMLAFVTLFLITLNSAWKKAQQINFPSDEYIFNYEPANWTDKDEAAWAAENLEDYNPTKHKASNFRKVTGSNRNY